MKRSGPLHVWWWVRPPILTAILVIAVLTIGTVGYVTVEGWSVWDALYMTVITVTTVGYREVHPLSRPGEAFTVVLLVAGVGTVFYAVTVGVARVIEGGCCASGRHGAGTVCWTSSRNTTSSAGSDGSDA